VKGYANCDMTTIVWQTDAHIADCRGFALLRDVAGAEGDAGSDFVRTWVGFKGQKHKQGESQPSTVWPVQRYIWSDYLVSEGQKVRYRVIPMIGPAGKLTKPPESEWSEWTDWIVVGTGQTEGFEAFFNRGSDRKQNGGAAKDQAHHLRLGCADGYTDADFTAAARNRVGHHTADSGGRKHDGQAAERVKQRGCQVGGEERKAEMIVETAGLVEGQSGVEFPDGILKHAHYLI